jgi:uncharacterized protein YfaP (DUF2135 family)
MPTVNRSLVALVAVLTAIFLASCDNFLQEEDTGNGYDGPTGTVEGTVRDATTGDGVDGATITVEGFSEFETLSSSDGTFSMSSPAGEQSLQVELDGYQFPSIPVTVTEDQTTTVPEGETVGSPSVGTGQVRMVLTWGESPSDLDSHLLTPGGTEIYFGNSNPTNAGANLDRDDTTSFGPETITITAAQNGTYLYWVYNWSGTPSITTSNAKVELYDSTGLVQTINVPTSGTGLYWNVLTLNYDGSNFGVSIVNQVQSSEPSQ